MKNKGLEVTMAVIGLAALLSGAAQAQPGKTADLLKATAGEASVTQAAADLPAIDDKNSGAVDETLIRKASGAKLITAAAPAKGTNCQCVPRQGWPLVSTGYNLMFTDENGKWKTIYDAGRRLGDFNLQQRLDHCQQVAQRVCGGS